MVAWQTACRPIELGGLGISDLRLSGYALQVSAFGPMRILSQRVNQCCVSLIWIVMQGEYTEVYPGSGKRRPYVQRGEGSIIFPCT
jgi:hypothetical protein